MKTVAGEPGLLALNLIALAEEQQTHRRWHNHNQGAS
jgi:hypothetical protein